MYPLTIGLAIENRELWEQAQACLADLPFRIIVEHQDLGDVTNFIDRLERMRPDVVLVDISGWKEPLEGLVASIRNAAGDPMIIALNTSADADTILSSLRAGVNEYLYPPLQEPLRQALEKRAMERSRRRDGGARATASRSASSPPRAAAARPRWSATWPPNWAGATRRCCWPISTWTPAWSRSSPRPRRSTRFWTRSTTCTGWISHYWKALVSNGIPGVEIVSSPLALASKQQPKDEQIRHVLAFARPHYDWTLVDLGRSLSRIGMAALEEIDEACLVTTLEVPALHQSKQIIQTLLDSGYGKNRIRLILNRSPKRLDITPGELEKMLGRADLRMVPNDYPELYETYAEGRMLNRSSRTRQADRQAGAEAGGTEEEKPRNARSGSDCSDKRRNNDGSHVWIQFRDPARTGRPAGSTGCSPARATLRNTRS